MPVSLPCSLTQTAGGADLYLNDNPAQPLGSSLLFMSVTGAAPTPSAPGANIDFSTGYPAYVPGTPVVSGTVYGSGFKQPPGVYLARLSVPNVGEAANGFTKGCFTFTWDGANLTAGASSNPSNDVGQALCSIATTVNGTTGFASVLTWGWRNLVGAAPTATIDIVLIERIALIPLF
jgi:hypothetical protein